MTMYAILGVAVCLAVFGASAGAANLIVMALAPVVRRWARGCSPGTRATALFLTASLPAALAVLATFAFALPAFLLFEPAWAGETIGFILPLLAFAGLGIAGASLRTAIHLQWTNWRVSRCWRSIAHPMGSSQPDCRLLQVPVEGALLGTVGLIHPSVYASRDMVANLNHEELAAALAHEAGHVRASDNLKRLILLSSPGLALTDRFLGLRKEWTRACESAADEAALQAGVSPLDLAAALVKAGRLRFNADAAQLAAMSHLVAPASESDVQHRVRQLVARMDTAAPPVSPRTPLRWTYATVAAGALAAYAVYFFPLMRSAHELLEFLVR